MDFSSGADHENSAHNRNYTLAKFTRQSNPQFRTSTPQPRPSATYDTSSLKKDDWLLELGDSECLSVTTDFPENSQLDAMLASLSVEDSIKEKNSQINEARSISPRFENNYHKDGQSSGLMNDKGFSLSESESRRLDNNSSKDVSNEERAISPRKSEPRHNYDSNSSMEKQPSASTIVHKIGSAHPLDSISLSHPGQPRSPSTAHSSPVHRAMSPSESSLYSQPTTVSIGSENELNDISYNLAPSGTVKPTKVSEKTAKPVEEKKKNGWMSPFRRKSRVDLSSGWVDKSAKSPTSPTKRSSSRLGSLYGHKQYSKSAAQLDREPSDKRSTMSTKVSIDFEAEEKFSVKPIEQRSTPKGQRPSYDDEELEFDDGPTDHIDPRADVVLNVGSNKFPVKPQLHQSTRSTNTRLALNSAGVPDEDPITSALVQLKTVKRNNSNHHSQSFGERYGGVEPHGNAQSAVNRPVPSYSEPKTPQNHYNFQAHPQNLYAPALEIKRSTLGAPPQAFTAEEMESTSTMFTTKTQELFQNSPSNQSFSRSESGPQQQISPIRPASRQARQVSPVRPLSRQQYQMASVRPISRQGFQVSPVRPVSRQEYEGSAARSHSRQEYQRSPVRDHARQQYQILPVRPNSRYDNIEQEYKLVENETTAISRPLSQQHMYRPASNIGNRSSESHYIYDRATSPTPQERGASLGHYNTDRAKERSQSSATSVRRQVNNVYDSSFDHPRSLNSSPSRAGQYADDYSMVGIVDRPIYSRQQQQSYQPHGGNSQQHGAGAPPLSLYDRGKSKSALEMRRPHPAELPNFSRDGQEIIRYGRAMYEYHAAIPEEVSFRKGDILLVTRTQEDGWWEVEVFAPLSNRPQVGLAPSNFCQVIG